MFGVFVKELQTPEVRSTMTQKGNFTREMEMKGEREQ